MSNDAKYQYLLENKSSFSVLQIAKNCLRNSFIQIFPIIGLTFPYFYINECCGDTYVAALGLVQSIYSIMFLPVINAFSQTLVIQSSQSYGNSDIKLTYTYYRIFLTLQIYFGIFVAISMIFLPFFFQFVGFDKDIVDAMQKIMIPFTLSKLVFSIFSILQSLLMSMKQFEIFQYVIFISVGYSMFSCYLFIKFFNLGIYGFLISVITNDLLNLGVLVYFIHSRKLFPQDMKIFTFKRNLIRDLNKVQSQLTIFLPIYLHIFSDAIGFQFFTISAGALGKNEVTAHITLSTFNGILFRESMGVAQTMVTYIGIFLGEKNIEKVKTVIQIGYGIEFLYLSIIAGIAFAFQNSWPYIFTDTPQVIQLVQELLLLSIIVNILDGVWCYFSIVFQVLEERLFILYSLVSSCLFLGFPMLYYLIKIQKQGIWGIWITLLAQIIFLLSLIVYKLQYINYQKIVNSVTDRLDDDHNKLNLFELQDFNNKDKQEDQ